MENSMIIMLGLACFLTGAAFGTLLTFKGTRLQSRQQLESRLQQAEQELKKYQLHVAEHFTHTSLLFSNMTRSYRDLHEHFTESSKQLVNIDIQPSFSYENGKPSPILGDMTTANPPLDYATKKGNIGTLSETYGLRDELPSKPPVAEAYSEV